MSKKKRCKHRKWNYGTVLTAIGVGVVIAVIIPGWGWVLVGGAGLICCGWYLINHCGS